LRIGPFLTRVICRLLVVAVLAPIAASAQTAGGDDAVRARRAELFAQLHMPVSPCSGGPVLRELTSTRDGLMIHASGQIAPRVVSTQIVSERAVSGASTVTIDIPGASVGDIAMRSSWPEGPFSLARIARYRAGDDCGVRLRLEPREISGWVVQPTADGAFLTTAERQRASEERRREGRTRGGSEGDTGGAIRVSGTYTNSVITEASSLQQYEMQVGFAQKLSHFGTLRGFASTYSGSPTDSPYAAIGVEGVRWDATIVDAAAGDVYVGIGDTPIATESGFNNLLLRGAGVAALFPNNISMQLFGGTTGRPTLIRSAFGTFVPGLGDDHVFGAEAIWSPESSHFSAGGGWIRSQFSDAGTQHNVFVVLEARRSLSNAIRVLLEQSNTADYGEGQKRGYAGSIEPRLAMRKARLSGVVRFVSHDFHTPAGSGFFSTLHRSYTLNGDFLPTDRLSFDLSAGQTKTFTLFDPQDIGMLSSSRGVSASYRLTNRISSYAAYSQSDLKSEPGAILPADSASSSAGVGAAAEADRSRFAARVSRESVRNRIDPHLDLSSDRVDAEGTYRWSPSFDVNSHAFYADARRLDGASAGSSYGGSVGVHRGGGQMLGLTGQVGFAITPAGVALTGSRQTFATIGVTPGSTALFQSAAFLTYQRMTLDNGISRSAWMFTTNAARLVQWGLGEVPLVPGDARAMRVASSIRGANLHGVVRVRVFADMDADGRLTHGEPGIAGVQLDAASVHVETDAAGYASFVLTGGTQQVTLEPAGAVLDYYIPQTTREVRVEPPGSTAVDFALRPAGRLAGRVEFSGELTNPAWLSGIRIAAITTGFERVAVTDDAGEFRFPPLPAGDYRVVIDRDSLAREVTVDSEEEVASAVRFQSRSNVVFRLRKATARERVGVQTGASRIR
jgi:hypothetical protein